MGKKEKKFGQIFDQIVPGPTPHEHRLAALRCSNAELQMTSVEGQLTPSSDFSCS